MLSWFAIASSSSFFTPTVRTQSGLRVTLHGTGPPAVFSSGLFGTMPRQLYSDLFRELSSDVTLAVVEDVGPLTSDVVEEIADALSVDRIGLVSHSSIDSNILQSTRIQAAVLCDPVVIPNLIWIRGGLVPPESSPEFPVRILKAERAYAEDTPGIPRLISPTIQSDRVSERTFADVGHADLLDDRWAELGRQTIPWMKGLTPTPSRFDDWTFDAGKKASAMRDAYRREVAGEIVRTLLDRPALTVETI